MAIRVTRFSDADWADQIREIQIIGIGGIGSWLSLNLARIGHHLYLVDGDTVDTTNVTGGQLYRSKDVGSYKVHAVTEICREFGCANPINSVPAYYDKEMGCTSIVITGLDNMKARKEVFRDWDNARKAGNPEDYLLIDGRLNMEMYEILTVQGNNKEQIEEYQDNYLFDDSEVPELSCTSKQSTFAAMGIASMITAALCNWLTNKKLEVEFREVPFWQRFFYPILQYKNKEVTYEEVF